MFEGAWREEWGLGLMVGDCRRWMDGWMGRVGGVVVTRMGSEGGEGIDFLIGCGKGGREGSGIKHFVRGWG
jgi:hypothetical protein